MSENVEVVRAAMSALAEEGVDGMIRYVHPDFEMTTPPEIAAEPGTYRGHAGVRRWFAEFYEVMDRVSLEATGLEASGEAAVAGAITIRARGAATGIDTELEARVACDVADGKIRRMRFSGG